MATFLEEYNALDTVPQQKARSYQMLSDNRSSLKMTPDEEYKFNWGPEALSEDWINSKAKQIQNDIENSNSTNILRRGLGKGEEAKSTTEEEKKEETKTGDIDPLTGKPRVESNHGNGNATSGNPRDVSDPETNPLGINTYDVSIDPAKALGALALGIGVSPVLGAKAAYNAVDINKHDVMAEYESYKDFEDQRMNERAQAERDASPGSPGEDGQNTNASNTNSWGGETNRGAGVGSNADSDGSSDSTNPGGGGISGYGGGTY